jgi:hexokinase
MLPSFNCVLPSGKEQGTYLALDVGGSTFRIALVELLGRSEGIRVVRMVSSHIDEKVKLLEGKAFFDWMAQKIGEMLYGGDREHDDDSTPLAMGLSWSFALNQTSIRTGLVIAMGKGFRCSNGIVEQDLSELVMEACRKRNLHVRVDAIVNDSSATLLSRAYTDPSTRMSLILGTGTNAALHFPIHAIGVEKFGNRPANWSRQESHVIVNTEMSMFGGGIFPMTRWDDDLNRHHLRPDYQPLEYMISGRYLGEIVRLIVVEAVQTAGLFKGEIPSSLRDPYSLDTSVAAFIEGDTSPDLTSSSAYLQNQYCFRITPSSSDVLFVRQTCGFVSERAAAYLATTIHSMWRLQSAAESPPLPPTTCPTSKPELDVALQRPDHEEGPALNNLTIACDGSVINKYPGFRDRCQEYLDQLTLENKLSPLYSDNMATPTASNKATSSTQPAPAIFLDLCPESALFGAAVAAAVAVVPR